MFLVPKTTCAKEVMQTRLTTVGPSVHFSEAVAMLVRRCVSGLPIVEADGTYLGMFSEKCCLRIVQDCPSLCDPSALTPLVASDAMATRLLTLHEEDDVFDGIEQLLSHRVSGAPVLNRNEQFVGIFSEKTSVSVLIQSVFDNLPSTQIGRFADRDRGRVVEESTPLTQIVETFVKTDFRRLPVLRGGQVVGQVSRRDVIKQPKIARWIGQLSDHPHPDPMRDVDYNVLSFADKTANTIGPDLDLLSILGLFLSTPYRRLPVVENGRLVGQISRRDVLQAVMDETKQVPAEPHGTSLYLSALGGEFPRFG
ncbi:putative voltage-gated ClC-type chloride channel ClcB [Rosistilla carotiformis]|uniref:Putative voltage-gated ClC-type chloride channel ClcB n=1 Tax=Rosistilla carotiformis TaxID=2528017 RepID=A0A518JS04_9BACT|nr:CBS domain-containing protein [Rosistilla carotiformis]QDV68329.1 putative voltage-gated ClC-type chloride channel ClcB [Rosistilla carotiformis]